jgi:hypothetical protein
MVKHFARQAAPHLRHALLDVLIDARYELADALAGPPEASDPVVKLFLSTWERLAPLVREATKDRPAQASLQYLSFIASIDALSALNKTAPEFGLEISADGLRRLARMLDPAASVDPLAYSVEVDPDLRTMLGLGPPLPPPDIPQANRLHNPESFVPQGLSGYHALIPRLREWLMSEAQAAPSAGELGRLNRWVPDKKDLNEYLPLVQTLLEDAGDKTLMSGSLAAEYRKLYADLVLAAAWQESCWRQFVRNADTITALTSASGSVGLMQINAKVWRGVYDIKGIYSDIAYNARAGCEILLHYLKDYALQKGEHLHPGGPDNLARAAYAAYNGGPVHLARYRATATKQTLRQIDALFWQKYVAVQEGRALAVASCY